MGSRLRRLAVCLYCSVLMAVGSLLRWTGAQLLESALFLVRRVEKILDEEETRDGT